MTEAYESSVAGLISFEEFRAQPHERLAEWAGGRVERLPDETAGHARLREWVFTVLDEFTRRNGDGEAFTGVLMRLVTQSARVPDVAVVLNESRSLVWDDHLGGPADLVVEILREGASPADYSQKFYEYEASGVCEYWFVDPEAQRAEFYMRQPDGEFPRRPVTAGAYRSETLPGFLLRPEWLWALPDPASVGGG